MIKSPGLKRKSVSAVIPVFDEEKNIGEIVAFLLKNPLLDEIICVNDGSTDKSLKILLQFKEEIKIINLEKNHGKGFAVCEGIKKAKGEILLFLDADLINLKEKHIKDLLEPILNGAKKAVLGYGTPSKNHLFSSRAFVKSVTGQRAYYKKDILPHLSKMAKTRYGVEIYLNSLFKKKQTAMVPLIRLSHIWKHKKHSPQKAFKQYIQMGTEVASQLGKEKVLKNKTFGKIKKAADQITDDITDEIKDEINEFKKKTPNFSIIGRVKTYYDKIDDFFE